MTQPEHPASRRTRLMLLLAHSFSERRPGASPWLFREISRYNARLTQVHMEAMN